MDGWTKDVVQSSYCKHVQLPWDTCLMFDICLDDPLFSVSLAQVESVACSFSSKQRPTIHLPSLQCFQSCWLLVVYFCCLLLLLHNHYHHFYYHRYYHRITVTTY